MTPGTIETHLAEHQSLEAPHQVQALSTTSPLLPAFSPDTPPVEVIRWALEAYPDLLMPSAFNLNGVVLLDLAAQAGYIGEVAFVDTGYHFAETLETRDRLATRYPRLRFVTLSSDLPSPQEHDPQLYLTDPDACCAARKVGPLNTYLEQRNPSALLNGRSQDQASTRSSIGFVEMGKRTRINPLAYWTRDRLEAHAKEQALPVNPLYWDGFLSIGCWPCTRAVRPGEDARSGRWAGQAKTECGLWVGDRAL